MYIIDTIAENLYGIRAQKKLTLEEAANLTGVSRSMLAQIEKGDVNPTISILWKIAQGYGIPFTSLLDSNIPKLSIIKIKDSIPVVGQDDRYVNYPLHPYDNERHFETHYIEILPGGAQTSAPHMPGTEEFITVFQGKVEISIQGKAYVLSAGESINFAADFTHSYKNIGKSKVIYHLIIYYR
ncbi:MAG: XRE family transcriptional regulator [Tissierellia bacterium]|nr:XRE family transcriptional regulator [Tissierellia bacterium]